MSNQQYTLDVGGTYPLNARLLYVSSAKYEGDWHSTPHTHFFAEMFYVLRGTGRFLVENTEFPVKENDLVIVNPNVAHTEMSRQNSPLEYIVLGVEGITFSFHQNDTLDSHHVFTFQENRMELLFYLKTLLNEAEREEPYHDKICQNLLEVMLIHMLRQADFSMSVIPSKKANIACGLAKRYIDAHFSEPITLQDLADLTHVNKYYLAHIFTEDYGLSPINYLINRRIEESKTLLTNTNHSISQIAAFTGFSSQSYFSQSFKKLIGLPPNEYRQKTRTARG